MSGNSAKVIVEEVLIIRAYNYYPARIPDVVSCFMWGPVPGLVQGERITPVPY